MPASIRNKLLQLLSDTSIDELPTERLLDLLSDKLSRQQEEIKRLLVENSAECQRLQDEREMVHRELNEFHRSPTRAWIASTMDFSFTDEDANFIVRINFGNVELIKIQEGINCRLQPIPHL